MNTHTSGVPDQLTPAEREVLSTLIGARQLEKDIRRYAELHSRNAEHHLNTVAVTNLVVDLGLIDREFQIRTPPFVINGLRLNNVEARFLGNGPKGIVVVTAH